MRAFWIVFTAVFAVGGLFAQQPQSKSLFEKKYDEGGYAVKVAGKNYGPYTNVGIFATNSDASVLAISVKNAKGNFILFQGKEVGPFDGEYYVDSLKVTDSGKFWVATASASEKEILIVNGKVYGPTESLSPLIVSLKNDVWLAVEKIADSSYKVLVSGKEYGPFPEVSMTWLSPDGQFWAFVVSKEDGTNDFYTPTKTWKNVSSVQTDSLQFDKSVWGYKIVENESDETYVIGSKTFTGYRFAGSLVVSPQGSHWGFEALKASDSNDQHVVVIDGNEYPGENLSIQSFSGKQAFVWIEDKDEQLIYKSLEVR